MSSFSKYCETFFEHFNIDQTTRTSETVLNALFEQYKYSAAKRDILSIQDDIVLLRAYLSYGTRPEDRDIPFVEDFSNDFYNLMKHFPKFPYDILVDVNEEYLPHDPTRIEEITNHIFDFVFTNSHTIYSERMAKDLFRTHLVNPLFITPLCKIITGTGTVGDFLDMLNFINVQWNLPYNSSFSKFCITTFPEFNKNNYIKLSCSI